MTPHKRRLRVILRLQSRWSAWTPEVYPLGDHRTLEHPAVTPLRRLDRLDQISVVTTHTPTPEALTIQRP